MMSLDSPYSFRSIDVASGWETGPSCSWAMHDATMHIPWPCQITMFHHLFLSTIVVSSCDMWNLIPACSKVMQRIPWSGKMVCQCLSPGEQGSTISYIYICICMYLYIYICIYMKCHEMPETIKVRLTCWPRCPKTPPLPHFLDASWLLQARNGSPKVEKDWKGLRTQGPIPIRCVAEVFSGHMGDPAHSTSQFNWRWCFNPIFQALATELFSL